MKKYAAFFDLDRTIIDDSSGTVMVRHAHKKSLLTRYQLYQGIVFSMLFRLNLVEPDTLLNKMGDWLKGTREEEVMKFSRGILDTVLIPAIRERARKTVEMHREEGAHTVILSASIPYICRPICEELSMDNVICSSLEVKDGVFTGNADGAYCYEMEKKRRIEDYCAANGFALEDTWYYGDAYSDRFVLEASGNPVCVTPDRKLKKLALRKGWGIEFW